MYIHIHIYTCIHIEKNSLYIHCNGYHSNYGYFKLYFLFMLVYIIQILQNNYINVKNQNEQEVRNVWRARNIRVNVCGQFWLTLNLKAQWLQNCECAYTCTIFEKKMQYTFMGRDVNQEFRGLEFIFNSLNRHQGSLGKLIEIQLFP